MRNVFLFLKRAPVCLCLPGRTTPNVYQRVDAISYEWLQRHVLICTTFPKSLYLGNKKLSQTETPTWSIIKFTCDKYHLRRPWVKKNWSPFKSQLYPTKKKKHNKGREQQKLYQLSQFTIIVAFGRSGTITLKFVNSFYLL